MIQAYISPDKPVISYLNLKVERFLLIFFTYMLYHKFESFSRVKLDFR